jgi:hypothetical protein
MSCAHIAQMPVQSSILAASSTQQISTCQTQTATAERTAGISEDRSDAVKHKGPALRPCHHDHRIDLCAHAGLPCSVYLALPHLQEPQK